MNKPSMKFLESLLMSSGPSGFEWETAGVFRGRLSEFCADVRSDVMGNTIGVVNPGGGIKVMLAGHYDEIGLQITYIADEGFLHFRPVGGVDRIVLPGIEVEVLAAGGRIPGVIGKKPIHLVPQKDRESCPEIKDLWIDIGAKDKKEASAKVAVGDPVAPKANMRLLGTSRIMSKGLDDKIGAFVVAEAARMLSRRKVDAEIHCVGTVQEELGLRGAQASAFGVAPDVGIAVDVGFATDVPDLAKKEFGDVKLGGGPILSRTADFNPVLGRILRSAATKHKIAVQETAGHRASGGTDTAAIQLTRSGVATGLVSIPNRYMHTPVEMCDLRDVEAAIWLIVETVASLKTGQTFIPGVD